MNIIIIWDSKNYSFSANGNTMMVKKLSLFLFCCQWASCAAFVALPIANASAVVFICRRMSEGVGKRMFPDLNWSVFKMKLCYMCFHIIR